MTPLAQGFAPEARIENVAALRLTDSGVSFIEQNLGNIVGAAMGGASQGVVEFPVNTMNGSFGLGDYTVCPAGPDETATPPRCIAELDLGAGTLTFEVAGPHDIVVSGPLPVRVQNLPIDLGWLGSTHLVLNGNGVCHDQATPPQTFANIQLNVDLSIEIDPDPGHSRWGYSKLRIAGLSVNNPDLEAAANFCGGGLTTSLLNALKPVMVALLSDMLVGTVKDTIEAQFCQKANPLISPTCPDGTTDVDGTCRYGSSPDDPCASTILGLEGNVDLGALMGALGGARGTFDFLLAAGGHTLRDDNSGYAWGDLNPIGGGATLGMYGGTEPTPTSLCVPQTAVEMPTGIAIPDELMSNTVVGWPSDTAGPHVGIAISERFLNFALAQMYNAGGLCLGITGEGMAELNSNLIGLGLGAPSMTDLGRMREAQPIALVTRPQQPPTLTVGNGTSLETDPLIRLVMNQMAIDFYVWSLDRYIRAMTVTVDIDVPANLEVTPEGLQPVLEEIHLSNAVVENSALLREDPTVIAGQIQDLVGSMVGSLLGSLPVIDVNEQLAAFGLELIIPPTVEGVGSPGLRKIVKNSDNYLGIFAGFAAAQSATAMSADTSAELADFEPARGAPGASGGREPSVTLRLGSSLDDGTERVQWQVRVAGMPWRPFSDRRSVTLSGAWLRRNGRHLIEVRSRAADDPMSLDPTPATVEVVVDAAPPVVRPVQLQDGRILLRVQDSVSSSARVRVRTRTGTAVAGGIRWDRWSDWLAATELEPLDPGEADVFEVEAEDEEGNVGTASQALIRGRVPGGDGSCQCRTVRRGTDPTGAAAGWLAAVLLALVVGVRRRRNDGGRAHSKARAASRAVLGALSVVLALGMASGCACDEEESTAAGCRGRGDCQLIEAGVIGAYASAAVAPDGTLWVAGYLESNWDEDYAFGDLVVGRWDAAANQVGWQTVDGVPAEPSVDAETYDPNGFRYGQTEPGDDVGLWTSLAIDPAGNPAVAYYDATHRALRYAHQQEGSWQVAVVDQRDSADIGRYAKLLFVGGLPVISYNFIEPGDAGSLRSGVRVATGSEPSAAAQWGFEEVIVEPATPCRAAYCVAGMRCVESTGTCANSASGCPECAAGEECVDMGGGGPQCQAVFGASKLDAYPEAVGLYVSAAPHPAGGFGLAFYDRLRGNLLVASNSGAGWNTVVVDGESGGLDTGDTGVGASLFIDGAGHYHVAYVDGLAEAVKYVFVADGVTPGTPEVVDDGYSVDGVVFPDGLHVVGDDTDVWSDGTIIRISYQDATAGTLRLATGTPDQTAHGWLLTVVGQEGFAGAFSQQVDVGGVRHIVNFWRMAMPTTRGDVRVLMAP
ncbi:MAG: hypothetical protein JRI23_02905 [Deltaproteobacteria bacterium]|nr:hypothetical protein [Deltaproteobacteria bacterium]MBW2530455.1 hypothetical protein [Deltaproteobacteria bacterium]